MYYLNSNIKLLDTKVIALNDICPSEIIVSIRKSDLVNINNSVHKQFIESLNINDDLINLVILLNEEFADMNSSKWLDYLERVNLNKQPSLALFWKFNENINGLEIYTDLTDYPLIHYLNIYNQLVTVYNIDIHVYLNLIKFIKSKSFYIDNFYKLSMVPFADKLNHSDQNNCHFESELIVCSVCGKLFECPHDNFDNKNNVFEGDEYEDSVEIVSKSFIPKGEELFNTYGNLSNKQLALRYGFILDANPYDIITFDDDDWYFKSSFNYKETGDNIDFDDDQELFNFNTKKSFIDSDGKVSLKLFKNDHPQILKTVIESYYNETKVEDEFTKSLIINLINKIRYRKSLYFINSLTESQNEFNVKYKDYLTDGNEMIEKMRNDEINLIDVTLDRLTLLI